MKIIQSLWTHEKSLLSNNFGWLSPQYHLMAWCLSSLLLKKHYEDLVLCTDNGGKEILIDYLNLPYQKTELIFNDLPVKNEKLWALPKLMSYARQDSHFVHVDGDVFLWKKFPKRLAEAETIAQNSEIGTIYYRNFITGFIDSIKYLPDYLRESITHDPVMSYNAGIIGGRNIAFFKKYAMEALEIALKNDHIEDVNFNILFEQILFATMARKSSQDITTLFTTPISDNGYSKSKFCDFLIPLDNRSYMHVIGGMKRDLMTCEMISKTLFQLYPAYHHKIMKLFNSENLFYRNKICLGGVSVNYGASVNEVPEAGSENDFYTDFKLTISHLNSVMDTPVRTPEDIEQLLPHMTKLTKSIYRFESWVIKVRSHQWKKLSKSYFEKNASGFNEGLKLVRRLKNTDTEVFLKASSYIAFNKRSLKWSAELLSIITGEVFTKESAMSFGVICVPQMDSNGIKVIVVDTLDINLLVLLQNSLSFSELLDHCYVMFNAKSKTMKREIGILVKLRIKSFFSRNVIEIYRNCIERDLNVHQDKKVKSVIVTYNKNSPVHP